jgi:hypothetical protein
MRAGSWRRSADDVRGSGSDHAEQEDEQQQAAEGERVEDDPRDGGGTRAATEVAQSEDHADQRKEGESAEGDEGQDADHEGRDAESGAWPSGLVVAD